MTKQKERENLSMCCNVNLGIGKWTDHESMKLYEKNAEAYVFGKKKTFLFTGSGPLLIVSGFVEIVSIIS